MKTHPIRSTTPRNKTIAGSFDVDAAGAVSNVVGYGFTAAYSAAAGKWNITITDPGATLVSAIPGFEHATGADASAQLGPYSAGVLQVRLWDFSGAALANVAGTYHFRVVMTDQMQ